MVGNEWQENVEIAVDDHGVIQRIQSDIDGPTPPLVALPGMINVHSHAFQRGFVGLSEYRTEEQDSFWTWRKLMYDFVSALTPEKVFSVAKQLYLEMLRAGYTWVGEFHYLHNDPNGNQYSNLAEMSAAILQAATETGIGLCHLPVLYQRGGFENEPLVEGQNRFALSNDQFAELFERCHNGVKEYENSSVGVAIHSLRAVSVSAAQNAIRHVHALDSTAPVHIHVAEQLMEVMKCVMVHGCRPVQFLYDNFPVDETWCLIHATHLDDDELGLVCDSGAVAGLCPTTEANLGDGFFRAFEFLQRNGQISIGSDSHCSVDFREELRLLEYGQRLRRHGRAILGTNERSVGRNLYCRAALGGAKALGLNAGEIAIGKRADFTLVDPQHPTIEDATEDRLLDRLIFANIGNAIAGVVVGGKTIMRAGERA